MSSPAPTPVTLARRAMSTRWELVLPGDDPIALRAAGEEALNEIERIEDQLSLYRATSEIARVNAQAARQPVRVTPAVFGLLRQAQQLQAETRGAFDITIGPLMRCWGFMDGSGQQPAPEALAAARACVGINLMELDEAEFTVRFQREGVFLDLGAIGKGCAAERAGECLREAGVTNALLHGGTSTIVALGHPPEEDAWRIALGHPAAPQAEASGAPLPSPLAVVALRDEALSVSAIWGKAFQSGGKTLGHVIDPRTGAPVTAAVLAAVVLPSATETDALSTALLTAGPEAFDMITRLRPGMRALLAEPHGDRFRCRTHGITVRSAP